VAKSKINDRRREEGLKQLEERQRDIKAGNDKDPLADSIPLHLSFEQRLKWLEDKLEEKKKKEQVVVQNNGNNIEE
jgi:hypothetical protein